MSGAGPHAHGSVTTSSWRSGGRASCRRRSSASPSPPSSWASRPDMLEPVLFALFSVSAVVFAFNVVFRRNAVHCALHLVGVLLSLSGMFVLLNAQFIAAIQILIYAGAIMVLFLFVVM